MTYISWCNKSKILWHYESVEAYERPLNKEVEVTCYPWFSVFVLFYTLVNVSTILWKYESVLRNY